MWRRLREGAIGIFVRLMLIAAAFGYHFEVYRLALKTLLH